MSAELVDVTGRVLTIKVSGLLTQSELAASQRAAGEVIDTLGKTGKVRLLIIIENFQGVAKEGDWGDVSFQVLYDDYIERLVIVCEPKWQEAALLFVGKGIRRVAIEYFQPENIAAARAWVTAD